MFGYWIRWWFVCSALWLVLTSTVSLNEVFTGFIAAALAATAATAVRSDRPARFERIPDLAKFVAALPVRAVADTALLTRALFDRDAVGRFREIDAQRADPAFAAVATVLTTAAPNHVLVDFGDDGTGHVVAVIHELVRRDVSSLDDVMRRP